MIPLSDCVSFLDGLLATRDIVDYDQALNGLQLANSGTVTRVAAAVDFSCDSVHEAVRLGADLLLVHHGMFWGEPRPILGPRYERLRAAITGNVAVYASHLPLDLHARLGNNSLLARHLELTPDSRFGRFRSIDVGVSGPTDLATEELLARVRAFAAPLGSHVVCSPIPPRRRTRRWAVVTGAGASTDTLAQAVEHGVDTLIVGEGPHHSAVEAMDAELVVMYAGHYATETLGVQALASEIERVFGLPWSFLHLPTGL
ncbi:MAG TPA: Nif3-like dinuclear metal center hexameric protein [Gemmatimonadaceae bacterium]